MAGLTGGQTLCLVGEHWMLLRVNIPIDSSLCYGFRFRYRQNFAPTSGTHKAYAGLIGIKDDGFTGVALDGTTLDLSNLETNSTNAAAVKAAALSYVANGVSAEPEEGWQTPVGYFMGSGPTGEVAGPLTDPGMWHPSVRYVRILIATNVGASGVDLGEQELDLVQFYDATAEYMASQAMNGGAIDEQARRDADAAGTLAQSAWDKAQAAEDAINVASSDNQLTPAEKPAILLAYRELIDGKNGASGLDAQADTFLVSRIAYDQALDNLATMMVALGLTLNSNEAAWAVTTTELTSPYSGSVFRERFAVAYRERQYLVNSLAAKARQLANTAQGTADTASSTATYASGQANAAITSLAGSKRFYNDVGTSNATLVALAGRSLLVGDLWFQRQVDGTRKVLRWTGTTWAIDTDSVPLLKAAEADIADIRSNLVISNGFELNGYAEDGSGNPTAGGKLYNPVDASKPVLKLAPTGIQIGGRTMDESWVGHTIRAFCTVIYTGSSLVFENYYGFVNSPYPGTSPTWDDGEGTRLVLWLDGDGMGLPLPSDTARVVTITRANAGSENGTSQFEEYVGGVAGGNNHTIVIQRVGGAEMDSTPFRLNVSVDIFRNDGSYCWQT